MPGGNLGRGVIVDCSTAFGGVQIDAARRVARAGASATWAQVTDTARPYGLRLPPAPSSGAFATSAGRVATNPRGPRPWRTGRGPRWAASYESHRRRGA